MWVAAEVGPGGRVHALLGLPCLSVDVGCEVMIKGDCVISTIASSKETPGSVDSPWERLGNPLPLGAESGRHNPQVGRGGGGAV